MVDRGGQREIGFGNWKKVVRRAHFLKQRFITDFDWYKGTIDQSRPVLIKRYRDDIINYDKAYGGPYRDIVISSLMSSHNNALKLLGCCLELPDPILVYEYAEIGPLNSWGGANIGI
ncbi:hypothetical protein TIFTF001_020197 [Ficus carica]|uniref:Uncharacterized protein n=1 Tax=Ficus carica TaxID=3494 RepID=A0AA88DJJ8_FICCA|nr:hypothetical protein TIFTF001_020197 [Ficus carica]